MVLYDIVDVGAVCMAIDKSGKCKGWKSGKRKKRPRNRKMKPLSRKKETPQPLGCGVSIMCIYKSP